MASDPRPFPWENKQNLPKALEKQITATTPLKAIWEDVEIASHFKPSSPRYFFIDNEALPNIKHCLTADQRRKLGEGEKFRVTCYNVHRDKWKLELVKRNDGPGRSYAFEGRWKEIMKKTSWDKETNICFWGISNEGRNNEEVRFLLTSGI